MIKNTSRIHEANMVPALVKPSGKQKPPTPPKPIQCKAVNYSYERLFDQTPTPPPLLQVDHNFDTISDRSLTDETVPLIGEEIDQRSSPVQTKNAAGAGVVAYKIKPPLLPKPANIPPRLQPPPERRAHGTNPFRRPAPSPPACCAQQRPRATTNPFLETDVDERGGVNPFGAVGSEQFNDVVERRLEINSINVSWFENSGVVDSLSTSSSSLDEITRRFNSDKECLIERNGGATTLTTTTTATTTTSALVVVKKRTADLSSSSVGAADHSNRSSWRSNSDADGDEISSRSSSSINEKSSSSSGGSPSIVRAGGAEEDEKAEDDSYSVRQRIRTWFGSFGKGAKSRRRDSKFYVEPDTESVSSMENVTTVNGGGEAENGSRLEENGGDGNAAAPTLTESERKERKAYFVIKELISSEKVFIDVLKLLTEEFVEYIRNASPDAETAILNDNDLCKIIDTLPQLKEINETMLEDLEKRLAGWSTYPKIADVIIEKGPFLKLFSTYIKNFEKQCNYLDEFYQKNARFAKAVRDFEALDRLKKLELKHYMLKPVQRLPQYKLLLEQYLSQLSADSIDYEDTQKALKIVCDVADLADRSVQQEKNFCKLLRLQKRLGNYEIIKPSRELVKEGELYKYSRKATHLRYFILLNDCLLYTIYTTSTFNLTVRHELPLAGMKVYVPEIDDYNNEFTIIAVRPRSYKLRARSPKERNEWVSALEKTIKEHNTKQMSFGQKPIILSSELGKQAPVWVPDGRVTMCQACTTEFTVTFRRHHCRACGKVVCGNCSANKAPLQYKDFEADRVCEDCYKYLLKEYVDSKESIIKNIEEQLGVSSTEAESKYSHLLMTTFKSGGKSSKKLFPTRLAVPPIIPDLPSGWLHLRRGRSWKKYWFVLKEHVLYVNNAPEDTKALETVPVLGYTVETFRETCSSYDDIDSKLVFQLSHAGQPPLVFYADSETAVEKWLSAFQDAVSIS